jgi:hypothetical protein
MQKDFIAVTPDSGSGNRTVTVTSSQNPATSSRSSSIKVSGGGMTRTIKVTQAQGGTVVTIKGGLEIIGSATVIRVISSQNVDIDVTVKVKFTPNAGEGMAVSIKIEKGKNMGVQQIASNPIPGTATILEVSPNKSSTQIYSY